jgi:hypothetical protein
VMKISLEASGFSGVARATCCESGRKMTQDRKSD